MLAAAARVPAADFVALAKCSLMMTPLSAGFRRRRRRLHLSAANEKTSSTA